MFSSEVQAPDSIFEQKLSRGHLNRFLKKPFLPLFLLLGVLIVGFTAFMPAEEEGVPLKMVRIPSGPFIMGSNEVETADTKGELGNKKPFYLDEHPQRMLSIPDYYIDRYEVSNEDYARFVKEKRRNAPKYWGGASYRTGEALLPVVDVNWYEARDYCLFRGKRLPTEAEWEKAARGPDGNLYTWGNEFDATKGNVSAGSHGSIMMIGRFVHDKSAYNVYDLNGNVMEWTADWYKPFPGGDYRSDDFGEQFKVAKGDAYGDSGHYTLSIFSRLPYRQNVEPETRLPFLGFRCVKS
ncbi:MAG: SUMF1/EgtB/PvdO family nonheme iron enzyme [Nitrospirota bacterium]|nr:SUMF1/EgtB/PvdO family nonheme iron enzyme [Nitrospirota bacterium]